MLLRLVVVGAGGHAASVIEAILAGGGAVEIAGVLDARADAPPVLGIPVLGDESRLSEFGAVVVAVGDNAARLHLLARAAALGLHRPVVVHPSAVVSPSATLGAGTVVLARAVVGARARVGEGAILNTASVVEHDCDVGRGAHVASGAVLGGDVSVGEGALVGLGASVRRGTRISARATVGVGAAVVSDVAEGETVAGVPARPVARPPRDGPC